MTKAELIAEIKKTMNEVAHGEKYQNHSPEYKETVSRILARQLRQAESL